MLLPTICRTVMQYSCCACCAVVTPAWILPSARLAVTQHHMLNMSAVTLVPAMTLICCAPASSPAVHLPQWYYAATTLPSECTGAGQDLMLVAGPESVSSYLMEAHSRRCHTVPSCKGHTGPCVSVQVRGIGSSCCCGT